MQSQKGGQTFHKHSKEKSILRHPFAAGAAILLLLFVSTHTVGSINIRRRSFPYPTVFSSSPSIFSKPTPVYITEIILIKLSRPSSKSQTTFSKTSIDRWHPLTDSRCHTSSCSLNCCLSACTTVQSLISCPTDGPFVHLTALKLIL